ncbi:5-(carboxyamino)imidazole ribonucleotide synthase [Halalkalicoccus jeotgali]|uniref:N5-carboxyaminoimidazole ribonucleotide synthase n=1 Tax=Halalkalicoccus jeotgali (strain DSM 18796 / CECT 7217 / JCM 14584 / KCTC 4019 / B3) TaxID=795797 RepID=D8J5M8_HALJB|nr:5-(carboxyamino)imidazole ribonucleotide synthase [Halalkalicoccus jeotgali]ADJ15724.1 phosphoribosylaminoimidazole carboxylase, ATPase subunit [Halalkalicoccus jeotgali B3]ELY36506.1 phosphoribosylaminoimidazole carboxylase, ATPase subunit [Halalkalicoccus jeotgali B3]
MATKTLPGPTIGVVGGGQLGRMLAEAAAPLGIETVILDPTPECPASPVASEQIVGAFDDPDSVRELAARADVLTFEIELADPDLLETVSEEADIEVQPSPETLRTIQDKLVQKRALADAGVPVPAFRAVDSPEELRAALEELGTPAMVKAREGGYDGRGNLPIEDPEEAADVLSELGGAAMVEEMVDFERELSVIAVKGDEEVATYVAGENLHEKEILRETVVPARASGAVRERAQAVAGEVLELMDGRGVYGIELFQEDGEILVNEIAPRPHNSGHWTIEGARSSQFEQHARAVCGLPLGATELREPVVTKNVLGDDREPRRATLSGIEQLLAEPLVHLHWYGKDEVRPLRKMGHFAVLGGDRSADELLESARTYWRHVEFDP